MYIYVFFKVSLFRNFYTFFIEENFIKYILKYQLHSNSYGCLTDRSIEMRIMNIILLIYKYIIKKI